jgi:chromosome segregation protein
MIRRLKSLELQGYKTFATLTRLEFPGQITAIVGPNGSGKSNIADSVRWVLGEQSFSLLRAKRTEDMIFSGSQQRSRAGMASTTITFNNEDNWLPIDYSEVAVSRRAYRDGQNEYLLNGQKVRLKDISELLSQTGLSERTYTIIGQGLVDVALALKPDERRQLFEEAAGIGLYRSRKEDALRRLENTRKNLDRILDIMTEIRPRLRALERQSKKFDEYQRLRSDLQILLLEWYGYHWHQKQKDVRIVSNDYQDQERRLSTLREKHSEVENKVEEAREELQKNRKQQEEAHRELSEYHRELEQAARQLAIIEERQRSNNRQKNNLEIDIANVEEEINQLNTQKSQFKAEIESRLGEFEAAEKEFVQAQEELNSVAKKKEEHDSKLNTLNRSRIALEKERVQTLARMEELNNRLTSLAKEKTKIESSLEKLKNDKDEIKKKIYSQESTVSKIEVQKKSLQNKIEDKGSQIDLLRKDERKLEVEISDQETKQSRLSAQLDVLIQAEAALSGYSEGSKNVVEDSRTGRLPGGIEPLSKHIIVDEKFEVAISAALGELTDLLVIPSRDRDIVIKYLESSVKNRVALVPMDDVPKQIQNRIPKTEGVFGYANELITVDEKYRKLVDNLFSDILIVRDRKSALGVQSQLNGTMKVVTLNGLVLQANGVMISGNNTSSKRIGRTRQKNEMEAELKALEGNIAKLKEQKSSISLKIEEIQKNQDELKTEFTYIEEEVNKNHNELRRLTDSMNSLDQQLTWHAERFSDIEENIGDAQSQISTIEDKLGSFESHIDQLHLDERRLQENINKLPLFEMQQALNHWQTHRIVTKNALEASQQRFEDHQSRFLEAKQRLETYQSRLSEITKGLEATKAETVTLKEEVVRIEARIQDVESTKIFPLNEVVEQNEQELSALEKLQDHSHKQVIVAERHFTQLELELSRRKDQLNNLRQRIEDDFGLVSFEYEQKIDGPTPLPFDDKLVRNLPRQQELSENVESDIKRLKSQVRRIGGINPEAQNEYLEVKERFEFLTQQIDDLEKASSNLKEVIGTLDGLMERDFLTTFKAVNHEFSEYFSELFNGGDAKLVIIDEQNPVEGGVEIIARLPGRREQGLALLSGGERSMTAVALIFALLKVSPTPFCILDEVDAILDESNVGRFIDLLRELSKKTQFVIITHNRNTVQAADVIYGVTMGRDSTSQMISLKLEDVDEAYLE